MIKTTYLSFLPSTDSEVFPHPVLPIHLHLTPPARLFYWFLWPYGREVRQEGHTCAAPLEAEAGGIDTEQRRVEEMKTTWLYIWSWMFNESIHRRAACGDGRQYRTSARNKTDVPATRKKKKSRRRCWVEKMGRWRKPRHQEASSRYSTEVGVLLPKLWASISGPTFYSHPVNLY